MKVLLTGFEPFGSETVNPSYEAIRQLPEHIGRAELVTARIPVSFEQSGPVLKEALAIHRPDIVICVGQAGGYSGIAMERVAINLQDASIPDNCGVQPSEQPILPDGPAAYFSSLPVKKLAAALRQNGIPAFVSNSAGTYVCNHLMYTLLHLIDRDHLPVIGGFIHVPYSTRQAAAKTPVPASMDLAQITRGLALAVETLV